tara:strand:- start:1094 stop:2491 length:1398 start_codon:yes stop_codon:yes gene_type:complete
MSWLKNIYRILLYKKKNITLIQMLHTFGIFINILFVECYTFNADDNFWGNISQFTKPYIVNIQGASDNDKLYTTQILSGYTDQCSTYYTVNYNNITYFIISTFFDNYNTSYSYLVNNEVKCNSNWPMMFLYRNSENNRTRMVKPELNINMAAEVYTKTDEAIFLTSDIEENMKIFGNLNNPLELSEYGGIECGQDNALIYEEVVGKVSLNVCSKLNLLSIPDKSSLCQLNIYDIQNLTLYETQISEFSENSYHPIYTESATHIFEVCQQSCNQIPVYCQPSPPPPSPPPPTPTLNIECSNNQVFTEGWNSFALIGDESTYAQENISIQTQYISELSDVQYSISNINITDGFSTGDNGFRIYMSQNSTFSVTCSPIQTTCIQTIQLYVGSNAFGIRSRSNVTLDSLIFERLPITGDVIENSDVYSYQYFVYYNNVWNNMTEYNILLPFKGYFYHTTQENTFMMNIC